VKGQELQNWNPDGQSLTPNKPNKDLIMTGTTCKSTAKEKTSIHAKMRRTSNLSPIESI
jgi:hypothetical protein